MANTQRIFDALGLTKEEQVANELKAKIISEFVFERRASEKTQDELAKESDIAQPMISRIESGEVDPQISTLIRLLYPLGKTLDIVPLD